MISDYIKKYKLLNSLVVTIITFGVLSILFFNLTGCTKKGKSATDSGKNTESSLNNNNNNSNNKKNDDEFINNKVKRSDYNNRAAYRLARTGKAYMHKGEVSSVPTKDVVSLSSSDESMVSVDKDGNVYSKKRGQAVITASFSDGGTQDYTITVRKNGFEFFDYEILTTEKLKLEMGFSNKLKGVKWTTSDKSIVKINKKGYAVAKRIGDAVLTCKKRGHIYYCNMHVTKKPKSIVYLTFDDGPSKNITPKILNVLKKNNAHATFFELKPAGDDFDKTERVINEGHTLALHGYQHKYDKIYRSVNIYHENLDKLQKLFHDKFGVWCTLSRFPGGSSNTVSRYNPGVMTKITNQIDDWNYIYVDWNVSSGDAGQQVTRAGVYKSVTQNIQKGRSNVVLMHDSPPKKYTLAALDDVIKYGKKHGFTFRALTPSSVEVHHGVNN